MKLHNSLKESRLQRGLTQEALAASVGVTRQTIISIEKEKFVPSVKLALELAAALDVPIGSLFRLESTEGEE
jgi:putative transcriptional regulator